MPKLVGKLKSVEGARPMVPETRWSLKGEAENYVKIPELGEFEHVSIECYALEGQFGGIQGIVSTWDVGRW